MNHRIRACIGIWTVGLALLARGGNAQSTPQIQKYRLQGTVVNSSTSEPVSRALVEIAENPNRAMLTDGEGHFEFGDVPEGLVTLVIQKPGFLGAGEFKGLNRNRVIVQAGAHVNDVILPLVPESVISGHLVDSNGTPIEGASVSLVRAEIVGGRKQWLRLPEIVTSDIGGNFRFAELGSGSYCVVVNTRSLPESQQGGENRHERYPLLLYYPGNPASSSAGALDLTAGQQAQIEIPMGRTSVFQVSGSINGAFRRQYSIRLLDPAGEILQFPVRFSPSGKFQIENVPGGTYVIRNELQDTNGHIFFSEQNINIASNIANLQLILLPPISIPISVRPELTSNSSSRPCVPPPDGGNSDCSHAMENNNVTVVLHSLKPFHMDAQSTFDLKQNPPQFNIANVEPGEYQVAVRSSLGYIASVTCGGVNLLRENLQVRAGNPMPPIEVILRDGAASISGNVRADRPFAEASVLLAPEFAPSQPPLVVKTNTLGGFLKDGLPPGDYRVFAFDTIHGIEYANPVVLSRYASRASRVTLSGNQNASLSVDLIVNENE